MARLIHLHRKRTGRPFWLNASLIRHVSPREDGSSLVRLRGSSADENFLDVLDSPESIIEQINGPQPKRKARRPSRLVAGPKPR